MEPSEREITFEGIKIQQDTNDFRQEWLVTNGIGGYASGSLHGPNTRSYHGLLVAALNAPLGRAVLLSKLEETVTIGGTNGETKTYELSANCYPGTVHPQGYRWLEAWPAAPVPAWVWNLDGVRLEKRVWMAHGQNRTYIAYRVLEAPADASLTLHLLPLLAWKDYHSEMEVTGNVPNVQWNVENAVLAMQFPPIQRVRAAETPLHLSVTGEDGQPFPGVHFAPDGNWYYRFQHPRESERGLKSEEDLWTPGAFVLPLQEGESVAVIADADSSVMPTEEMGESLRAAYAAAAGRYTALCESVGRDDEFARRLAVAAEAFVIQVPGRRSTIMAGYPWFSDWGRDTMIALPGLCLTTEREAIAREILLSFAEFVCDGLLPNRFPDVGEEPEYNTVDATLWYFVAIFRYHEATQDGELVATLWPVLETIIQKHLEGTRYEIHVDPVDALLYAGVPGVQLTWMDAKCGDWVVTPRIGKPVEINALWVNALATMAFFAENVRNDKGAAEGYRKQAQAAQASFRQRFPRPDGNGLYDVLDTPSGGADAAVRPNQVFALSLPFAPLAADSETAKAVLAVVEAELLTDCGLRTLSPHDPAYRPRYEGPPLSRDGAYHQGTVWPWLLGAFAEAHFRTFGDRDKAKGFLAPLQLQMTTYGVGSLAEVFDGDAPRRPGGCIAQAWSIAETLRVWKLLLP